MSRNGSGTYSLPAGNPVVTGTTIASTWANNTLSDIASALTDSVAADGQTPMTGNLDLNSNKIVNLATPTLSTDAATKNYVDTADGLALLKANNLSDVVSASTSRTNLGLGSIATQNSNNVSITGGSISGTSLNANDISSGTLGKARLPTGSVLQVVQGTYSTETTNSTSTFADTGLSASITPSATSSRILVLINHSVNYKSPSSIDNALSLRLLRESTTIATFAEYLGYTNSSLLLLFSASYSYLDSPSTTSSTTYKTQFASTFNSNQVRICSNNTPATITLLEIAA